jgi:hypothetical protein
MSRTNTCDKRRRARPKDERRRPVLPFVIARADVDGETIALTPSPAFLSPLPTPSPTTNRYALRPRTKCTIKQMAATMSSRWINAPAMWNARKPKSHATNSIKKSTRNILLLPFLHPRA